MSLFLRCAATLAAIVVCTAVSPPAAASTLDRVKAAGKLACGVVIEETDYSKQQTHGGLDDLGSELCKAIAVATLGEGARATVSGFATEQLAFKALAAGDLDVVAGVSPTATNGALYGAAFAPPFYFDGQGFLVESSAGISGFADLAGKQVCFLANTEQEAQLLRAAATRHVAVTPYPWEETGEMDAGLVTGHCAAITGDISMLAEERAAFHARKQDFTILPETITLDPVATAVRQGDPHWAAIVTWTLEAVIAAEAAGVTQANVQTLKAGDDVTLRRLLGTDHATGRALGLANDWTVQVIKAVGNYGEMYAHTIGPGTEYDLPRGRNALWTQGGLLAPLPFR